MMASRAVQKGSSRCLAECSQDVKYLYTLAQGFVACTGQDSKPCTTLGYVHKPSGTHTNCMGLVQDEHRDIISSPAIEKKKYKEVQQQQQKQQLE